MKAKINWADAPYWAQYWAMDADGSAYWYESCPHYDIYDEVWTPHIKVSMESNEIEETDCAPADAYGFPSVYWKNSKTERPSAYDALSSAGTDEYVEDKVMSDKIIFAEENMTTKVTRKDGKIKVRAGSGYAPGVDKLCTVKDTGNGFIVKFHSHSCTTQPDYHSIDYSHAAYLLMALLVEHNVGDTFGKIDIVDQD
jgi:hypothetical protein